MKGYKWNRYYRYRYYNKYQRTGEALGYLILITVPLLILYSLYKGIKWLILGIFGLVASFPISSAVTVLIVLYLVVIAPRFNKRKVKYVSTDEVEHKDNSDFYKNNGIF